MNKNKLFNAFGLESFYNTLHKKEYQCEEAIDLRSLDDCNIVIKDQQFLKIINENLGYGYDVKHQPRLSELRSLTCLDIYDYQSDCNYLYIKDISALKYLVNLKVINVKRSFVESEFFNIVAQLPKLKRLSFKDSYTIGVEESLSLTGAFVNGVLVNRVYVNPILDLQVLSESKSLEVLDIKRYSIEVLSDDTEKVRGELRLKGFNKLTSLKELSLEDFIAVDDENLEFIKELNHLEAIRLVNIPFKNVDSLNTLDKDASLYINKLGIKDYQNLTHPNLLNEIITHASISIAEVSKNKTLTIYDTGLKMSKDVLNLEIKTQNIIEEISYSDDQTLLLHVKNTDLFECELSYDLNENLKIIYPLLKSIKNDQ